MKLPLDTMTTEEKLRVMESIWEDLCSHPVDIPSPVWHGETLAQRDAAATRGEQPAQDWDAAKEAIRRATQ